MSKLKLIIGFALGYVAGSAAGRQRYEQIKSRAQRTASDPRVQAATKRAGEVLADKAPAAAAMVRDKAPVVAAAIRDQTAAVASAVTDRIGGSSVDLGEETSPPAAPDGVPLS